MTAAACADYHQRSSFAAKEGILEFRDARELGVSDRRPRLRPFPMHGPRPAGPRPNNRSPMAAALPVEHAFGPP